MTHDELFTGWADRAKSIGLTLSDVRKEAGIHAANFSNWRNGKGGMTLASVARVEEALARLEAAVTPQAA